MALNDGLRALMTSRDRPAGAHAADQDVHLAVRVGPDFLSRGAAVGLRVGGVLELLRHEGVLLRRDDLQGLADRALHAVGRRGEHQFGPQGLEHLPPLQAHGLRHGQQQPIAPRRGHERQRDPRVPAGGLHNEGLGEKLAVPFGRVDHRHADAVLHGGQGVVALQLDQHRRSATRQLANADQRRPPDCGCDVFVNGCHS
jgi:hypothetical protein